MVELRKVDEAVRRVLAGERDTFAVVIEAFHVTVRAFISSSVRDSDDADDLAQQAFVFAYEHLEEYRPETNILAWVKAIARNMVRDYHKRSRMRQAGLERYQREEIARRVTELSEAAADQRIDHLQECVETLASEQRSFLRMAHGRRSTLEELARQLGRTGAAIRKQLSRLHGLLKACSELRLGAGEAL